MKLHRYPLALLFAAFVAQAAAPVPTLPTELQAAVRCAAVFSIVAAEQARHGAGDWPPLDQRGREFFVRVSAQAMDVGRLDRQALQGLMQAEAAQLRNARDRAALKVPCLTMLDANLPVAAQRRR